MGGSWSAERGVKRRHEDSEADNETSTGDLSDSSSDLHTPKRKRFQSTAQYIVKKLFEEGTDSDVTIQALGRSWHLHKIYLSQCKYFDSMFSGQWAESEQPNISMEITDDNIDPDALRIAFRSLYTDNILVKPIEVIGVLAAATFLQLDPLIEHCRLVMKGCITCKTVCSFLTASECYGLLDIRDLCMSWLFRSLMVPKNAFMLSDITEDLLEMLLDSRELWIMQVEVDVYCQLKKWVFTQLNPLWSGTSEQLYKDASDFFKQRAESNGCCFLETAEGRRFIRMFDKVRWMYIINDSSCIQSLKDDQIVPYDWLNPVLQFCWHQHLRTEQGLDTGPREVSEDDFYKWSMRCGRILMHEQEYHWRWLGYAYGLDLLFTLRNKVLTINRNCGSSQRFSGSLSQQETRQVMLCVKMAQIKKKEMCSVVSTGIRTLSLQADDVESLLLTLNPATKFPLQVTMHLLYLTPDPALPFPSLSVPPTPVDVVPALPSASSPPSPPLPTPAIRGSQGGGGEGVPEGGAPRQARWTQGGGGGEGTSVVSRQTDSSTQVDLHTADSSVGGESSAVSMDTDFSGASGRMPALVVTSQSSASSLSLHAAKDDSQSRAEELNSSGCVAVVGEEKDVSGNARSDPCSFCVKSSPFSSSSLQLPVAKTPPHRLSPVTLAVYSLADSPSSGAEDPQSSVIADPKSSSSGDSASSCTDPKSSSGGPRSSSIDSQSSTPDPLSSSADHPKSSRVDPRSCSTDAQPATTADPQSSSSSTSQSSVLQRPHHGDVPSCSSASCKSVDASDSGSQPSAVSTPYPATPLPRTPSQVRQVRRSARVGSRSRSYLK